MWLFSDLFEMIYYKLMMMLNSYLKIVWIHKNPKNINIKEYVNNIKSLYSRIFSPLKIIHHVLKFALTQVFEATQT